MKVQVDKGGSVGWEKRGKDCGDDELDERTQERERRWRQLRELGRRVSPEVVVAERTWTRKLDKQELGRLESYRKWRTDGMFL